MITPVSKVHRVRLSEIRKSLRALGCKEAQFLKIELLFFEALDISRNYTDDLDDNTLLAALKNVQNDQYQKTKIATRKASERESSIRRFVVSFRKALS
jgi:hypothetical protein